MTSEIRQILPAPPNRWVIYSSVTEVEGRERMYPDGKELWAEPVLFYAHVQDTEDGYYDDEPKVHDHVEPLVFDPEMGDHRRSAEVVGFVAVVIAEDEGTALADFRAGHVFYIPPPRVKATP